jgi:YD repeat-containing protein
MLSVGRSGRYVRIQLGDTNYLSLAEVKVFAPATGDSQLVGFQAPLLSESELASPDDFYNLVLQGSTSGPGPSIVDPEIKELARGLRYDPGLMYKFVHDYIEFYPIWGDLKGPYMTWMDRSGNGFDQASLMIALLKQAEENCDESEYTVANPKYVVGEIKFSTTEAIEQFIDWFDIVNSAEMARKVLARAGLYGSVSDDGDDGITSVYLAHVWVKVTIDGNDYEFDPSFKSHTTKGGLDLGTLKAEAMGYNQTEFLYYATLGSDPGDYWIKDLNKDNIDSYLATYSTNLISHIKENLCDGGLADVIGGRSIDPAPDPAPDSVLPSSPPYDVETQYETFDIDNVPELYRTSLRIQHCGIDKTFWSSDIYGRRLSLRYNEDESNRPELVLDGATVAPGTATTLGQDYDLTISVDHPYDSDDFDGTTTLKVTAGGFYQIVNGWGDTGTKIIEKHRSLLEQYLYDGEPDTSEKVLGESFALVGLTWLAQTSRVRSLAAEIGSDTLINHHMVGITGQTGQNKTPYIDIPIGHLGVYSDVDDDDTEGVFLTIAGHAGGYEHEVIRQLQDCDAVSTIELLEMANSLPDDNNIFKASSSNWSTTIQPLLVGYSQDEENLVSNYVGNGFTVHLPQYGNLSKDNWEGIGFQAVKSTANCLTAGYVISGGYNGGAGTGANDPLSPSQLLDRSDVFAGENEGTYHYDSTDLTIGNGGLPFGLSFGRQYSSQRRLEDGPLGLGWTHNFDITAKVRSDSFQVLGEDSPIDAAAHIAALVVARDILINNSELVKLKRNMIASLCETWMMDQMMDNLVTIKQGGEKLQFTKVPDDSYNPPQRKALRLVVDDNTFLLKNSSGKFYHFDTDGRMTQWDDAHDNKVVFTYDNGKLDKVASWIDGTDESWSLSFGYDDNDRISTVTDSASRIISYIYDGDSNLTEYKNPDTPVTKTTKYAYDATNVGQLTKVFSPIDYPSEENPILTNVYDSLDRLKQQTDADGRTLDYYLAGYRAETLEPEQTPPEGPAAQFSTVIWANKDGLPIRILDQLGRETKTKYDGQHRPIWITKPSGMITKYYYDINHHLLKTLSLCKPDSPHEDPNRALENEYDSFENSQGRWFTPRTKFIDPNLDTTITHEYDPDVGTLLKTTYPEVDPTSDMNTPIIEFTYNTFGLVETKTNPEGMVTKFEYYSAAQGAGLWKTIVDFNDTDPNHLNITTELTYDDVGNVESIIDPRDYTTTNHYNHSRLPTETIPPADYKTTYEYYDDGKLQYVKKWTSGTEFVFLQEITYTDSGQKETVRGPYPQGATQEELQVNYTQYTYDTLGRLWKVTDAENNVTETRYYPDGRLWRVIDALGNATVTNTYDPNGYLEKVEDAKENATEYEYNGFGGLKKTTYADGSFTEPYYDPIRRLEIMRTRAGQGICVAYDDLHRLKRKELRNVWDNPNSYNTITYKYDLCGRVLETTDDTGTIINTYDTAGRLIQVEYPGDKVVSYEYDDAGNRTKLTYPDDSYITYEYDQLNRLSKIEDQYDNDLALYTYDKRSRRESVIYEETNGTSIHYTYDTASRLLSIDNKKGTTSQHKYAYTYDDVGNRLTMLVNDTEQHTYGYDDIYQVTNVYYPDSYAYFVDDTTFDYDDASNRISVIDGGTVEYVSNEMNQYNSVGGVSYDYDQNGNLTYDATCFYDYDAENRLTEVTRATGGGTGSLSAALDTDLSFTTGDEGVEWVRTTSEHYYGGDSAQSGDVSGSQTSWLETTVVGEGTIKFYRKISGEGILSFTIDSSVRENPSGPLSWGPSYFTYNVEGLGVHTIRWSYTGEGTAWVDYVQWTSTTETSQSLQEALDVGWPITTGGDDDWFSWPNSYAHDDDAAESGYLYEDEVSQMQATVEGEGEVTFYWKVYSEVGDYLKFKVDGVDEYEITGDVDWHEKTYTLTGSGTHTLLWEYREESSDPNVFGKGWVDWLQGPGTAPPPPDPFAQALDCNLSFTTGGNSEWEVNTLSGYYGGDSARSGSPPDYGESWLQTTVEGEGTVTFWWKVYSDEGDYLEFYIDSNPEPEKQIDEWVYWRQEQFDVSGPGTHTLRWRYVKDAGGYDGDDRGSVDFVQWSGSSPSPPPDPAEWETITYTYDPAGRRIKKDVVGKYIVKYVYDGDHVIAEYDDAGLLRKYIYGARVDEPVCMIECGQSGAAPVSHWKFDEGQGQTAYDSAGSNHGTITEATWTTGKFGGALEFDGNGDYVEIGDAPGFDNQDEITVSVWIYPVSNMPYGCIASKRDAWIISPGDGNNKITFYINDGSWRHTGYSTNPVGLNEWTHVVGVYDNTNNLFKLYFNGNEVASDGTNYGAIANDAGSLYIGWDDGLAGRYFNGTIDEVKIFDRALSEQEIQQLYNGQGGAA